MISRHWYVRWLCPHCGQVFIIPDFDVEKDPVTRACSWCNGTLSLTGSKDGVFKGPGHLIEKFPRLDVKDADG